MSIVGGQVPFIHVQSIILREVDVGLLKQVRWWLGSYIEDVGHIGVVSTQQEIELSGTL